MNILILEDDPKRIRLFMDHLNIQGNYVIVTGQVEEAKELLSSDKTFDMILLDHDLDGRVNVPSEEPNTGYQLAKWIAENNIQFGDCIVHSYNDKGAAKMVEVLPQATWRPFALKEKTWE